MGCRQQYPDPPEGSIGVLPHAEKPLTLIGVDLASAFVMRFGINTFLFTSPFTNDSTKLFRRFRQWGFETIEIPVEDPLHIDPAFVKEELDRHGLVCGSACACMGPGRDLRGTPEEQKTAMDYCKVLIDQMVVLNCPSLIGPVYSVVGKADAVEPARQKTEWTLVVKNLKELARDRKSTRLNSSHVTTSRMPSSA